MSKGKLENQLLIQVPDELSEQISKGIDAGRLPQIHLVPKKNNSENGYQRDFEFRFGSGTENKKVFSSKLMDLPCIIESQKTYNKSLYFKTGDISQMLMVGADASSRYSLDSGLTLPSSDIRERWSHQRPICQHDDVDINNLCNKCHNIPRGLINKMSKEIYDRMHGQASEVWELITTEVEEYVTDDDEDETAEAKMDRKLKNSSTPTMNEWELDDDKAVDFVVQTTENIQPKKVEKKTTDSLKVSENRNKPKTASQPPLPWTSLQRNTPKTTPRRNTPIGAVANSNLLKMSSIKNSKKKRKESEKNEREKREIELKLKTKENEVKVQEEKLKKNKNRKMKKKIEKQLNELKAEVVSLQNKLKSLGLNQ